MTTNIVTTLAICYVEEKSALTSALVGKFLCICTWDIFVGYNMMISSSVLQVIA